MGLIVSFTCQKFQVTFRELPPQGTPVQVQGPGGFLASPPLSQPAQSPGGNAPCLPVSRSFCTLESKRLAQQNRYHYGLVPGGLLPVHEASAYRGFTQSSLILTLVDLRV